MWILFSIIAAYWFKAEIPKFAIRINRQIYHDTMSLINIALSEAEFLAQSTLKPKQTSVANLFFLLFPLIMYFSKNPILGIIFILLCFLSLLDICYYLTDVRYILVIFLLVLSETLSHFQHEALFFTLLFCLFIVLLSTYLFHQEGFGVGDMLLLAAISPLFNFEEMLLLIFTACVCGIFYYMLYRIFKKEKLEKLAFIPFISLGAGGVYFI